MVYYRKYRPQTIAELDLESVRNKLSSILKSDDIPHAFLFAGPKGLGKTSSARILAKAVNCEDKKKGVEPCNKCSACISITNGSAVDVIEIDAASNRGIDEIRDLKERIKFSPSSLKKKVYIIDEVHMLTTEAFNALLKTLEEPPSHVMFILATTEMGKLPATITSRTFYVEFQKPTAEELERSLNRVVSGEGLDLESGVLEKISELSDGAFRDGAKILEDLSLQSNGKKITLELLESLYKTGSVDDAVSKITEYTLSKKPKEALEIISQLSHINADFKSVIEKIADKLHARLIDAVSNGNTEETFSTQKLLILLDEAYKNMRGTVIPSLPLELAVIGFCLEQNPEHSSQSTVHRAEKSSDIGSVARQPQEPAKITSSPTVSRNDSTTSSDPDLFKKLLDAVNAENKILAGLLRGSKLEFKADSAVIHPQSNFHREKLSESKNKIIIEQKLSEIQGASVAIIIEN